LSGSEPNEHVVEYRYAGVRDGDAARRCRQRQYQRLGEALANHVAARSAERRSDTHFLRAMRRAIEEQVGDVRARNQQNEKDGA
jgi:hypothetical protein